MPITMAQKPLMLKDFLELELDSTSCGTFRCAPRRLPSSSSSTIRCLLDAELSSRRLLRSRSKGAISAVVNLPRSLSKILLRRSFWRRRGDHTSQQPSIHVRVRDIVRLQSFNEVIDDGRSLYFPSPVVSSCCSATSSDDGADSSDFMPSSCGSSEFSGETGGPAAAAAAEDRAGVGVGGGESYRETATGRWQTKEEVKNEVNECGDCHSEEEKEQLSPVSVMDFPSEDEEDGDGDDRGYDDDDDDEITASPQFRRVLDTIERTRQELLQKIRRFKNLAELDLKPIDLESRFASTESVTSHDEEDRDAAWELLCRLKVRTLEDWPRSSEKLLLGFFDEGLSGFDSCQSRTVQWRQRARANRCVEAVEEDLVKLATEWIGGHGCVRREDMAGAEQLKEMESGGGWMCLDEGEEEVAEEVEAGVLGWLVGELVLDLVSPSC